MYQKNRKYHREKWLFILNYRVYKYILHSLYMYACMFRWPSSVDQMQFSWNVVFFHVRFRIFHLPALRFLFVFEVEGRGKMDGRILLYCLQYNSKTHINRLRARAIISYRVRENRKGPSRRDRRRPDPIWEIEHTRPRVAGNFERYFTQKSYLRFFRVSGQGPV